MYYVIKNSGVVSAPTLKAINVRLNAKFTEDEFAVIGKDFVVKCTDTDIDFVQDKHKMENILFSGFFKKDNSLKFICLFNLIFTFILMILINNIGG